MRCFPFFGVSEKGGWQLELRRRSFGKGHHIRQSRVKCSLINFTKIRDFRRGGWIDKKEAMAVFEAMAELAVVFAQSVFGRMRWRLTALTT